VLYFLSKALWLIAQPTHLMFLLTAMGTIFMLTRRRRLGLGFLSLSALLILTITALPVGTWLMAPLEHRFPPLSEMPSRVDGIIMLGGNENIAFADLARRYPKAKLVFTNDGPVQRKGASRGSQWMGIDASRVIFERRSRNTFEDVVIAKATVHPSSSETWILVDSAFHMPRSVGLFRAQNWRIVPYPVNFQIGTSRVDSAWNIGFTQNLDWLSTALKEWVGMLANRLLGHSGSLFPGPIPLEGISATCGRDCPSFAPSR
jgi:uncharacterized SAM-binding protein YcdF (DUF218 family)